MTNACLDAVYQFLWWLCLPWSDRWTVPRQRLLRLKGWLDLVISHSRDLRQEDHLSRWHSLNRAIRFATVVDQALGAAWVRAEMAQMGQEEAGDQSPA